jgi:hypothetical protein
LKSWAYSMVPLMAMGAAEAAAAAAVSAGKAMRKVRGRDGSMARWGDRG